MKSDGRVGYVEVDFEFKCDWKCELTVCYLICVMIGRVTVEDMNSNSIDIPLDTNVGTDLEALDLVNLEALDLVNLEALDTSVDLVAFEPIGLYIVHKEVKTGVSNIVFLVSRFQGFKGVMSLQHLLLAFFFGFVVDLVPFVALLPLLALLLFLALLPLVDLEALAPAILAELVAFLDPFGATFDPFVLT